MTTEPRVSVEDVVRGLPAHKIGRLWRFKLSEVDKWVRACGADAPDKHEREKK